MCNNNIKITLHQPFQTDARGPYSPLLHIAFEADS